MEKIKELLEIYLNDDWVQAVISAPRGKAGGQKIHIRPVEIRGRMSFQASEYKDNKVYHHNLEREEAILQIIEWMEQYRQMEITVRQCRYLVLVSKKGRVTVLRKGCAECVKEPDLSHNRKKHYILEPDKRAGFLIDLGVQTKEGKIVNAQYDKFRQINRFLEFIEDILPQLPKDRQVRILDFGCGKSYLTFAMYYYLKILKGYDIHITGLDLKEDVMNSCQRLAEKYGYEGLDFQIGDIAGYEDADRVDMVVTLHACDTATDYALDKAIRWGAKIILSVPCCQHELNGQMENELLAPVLQYGLIRERMAALFTDAIRAQILESKGYDVQILEFIDMEHTPKNILIRAVKTKAAKEENYRQILDFLHVMPALEVLQQAERTKTDE